ncbi:MAG: LssY C-terminal domain-containing protein [Gemmataceae bacterium]|nr:LssY C-terminal domain-containing protein [Gemmataceae bacterium]
MLPVACLVLAWPCADVVSPPAVTHTADGRAGDPVNLRLVGARAELDAAFRAAGWSPADPVTVRSAVRIGVSVALDRPYPRAPVSDLYLFGRVQDAAFQRAVGGSARTRHHVRFWRAGCEPGGRPVWIGAGTFDVKVGRSPATGKLTHRISPDVDAERDTILADLVRAGGLADVGLTPRAGPFAGRNGEGDCYVTDGRLGEGTLAARVCGPVCEGWRDVRARAAAPRPTR